MIVTNNDASYRYRVGRVASGVMESWSGDRSRDSIILFDVKEFKDPKAAKAYREKLAREGYQAIQQTGVLHWVDDETAVTKLQKLQADGAILV